MNPAEYAAITKAMRIMGRIKSPAKTKAARANAKLGGWPKGKKRKPAKSRPVGETARESTQGEVERS